MQVCSRAGLAILAGLELTPHRNFHTTLQWWATEIWGWTAWIVGIWVKEEKNVCGMPTNLPLPFEEIHYYHKWEWIPSWKRFVTPHGHQNRQDQSWGSSKTLQLNCFICHPLPPPWSTILPSKQLCLSCPDSIPISCWLQGKHCSYINIKWCKRREN